MALVPRWWKSSFASILIAKQTWRFCSRNCYKISEASHHLLNKEWWFLPYFKLRVMLCRVTVLSQGLRETCTEGVERAPVLVTFVDPRGILCQDWGKNKFMLVELLILYRIQCFSMLKLDRRAGVDRKLGVSLKRPMPAVWIHTFIFIYWHPRQSLSDRKEKREWTSFQLSKHLLFEDEGNRVQAQDNVWHSWSHENPPYFKLSEIWT